MIRFVLFVQFPGIYLWVSWRSTDSHWQLRAWIPCYGYWTIVQINYLVLNHICITQQQGKGSRHLSRALCKTSLRFSQCSSFNQHTNSSNCRRTVIFISYIISAKNANEIIGYFTVDEREQFLFTSCVKQTNERSEWACFTKRVTKSRTSELYFLSKGNNARWSCLTVWKLHWNGFLVKYVTPKKLSGKSAVKR